MELRHIYKLADIINESILEEKLPKDVRNDITIVVNVSPTTAYGIDKEFYRLTHDNNDDGFVHSKDIDASISNVKFSIREKVESLKSSTFIISYSTVVFLIKVLSHPVFSSILSYTLLTEFKLVILPKNITLSFFLSVSSVFKAQYNLSASPAFLHITKSKSSL